MDLAQSPSRRLQRFGPNTHAAQPKSLNASVPHSTPRSTKSTEPYETKAWISIGRIRHKMQTVTKPSHRTPSGHRFHAAHTPNRHTRDSKRRGKRYWRGTFTCRGP